MFAIRQKSTGWWLPPYPGRAGGTHVEPSAQSTPRLFRRRQDAKAALLWWLRGRVVGMYDLQTGDFEGCHAQPDEDRRADDMEIVEVAVVPVQGVLF